MGAVPEVCVIITRSRLALITTIAVLLAAAALFTNILPFRQILAQHDALDRARMELDVLTEENARLDNEVAALMTDSEVERIAREQFGYVMPGERAIVIVAPPDGLVAKLMEVAPVEVDRPIWQRIWDFLTGHDVGD